MTKYNKDLYVTCLSYGQ